MSLTWSSWSATDLGTVRGTNEDSHVDRPDLRIWAVADGAGGHEHGEVASAALKAAIEGLPTLDGADLIAALRAGVDAVHEMLRLQAAREMTDAGHAVTIASTLVVLLADGVHFACLWCGDSRAYLLRGGVLTQITRDHSLVQQLVDAGMLDAAEMESHPHANVLTRAVGGEEPPELDKMTGRAAPGDRFLLCSDGLFKALDAGEIGRLAGSDDPARALIAAGLAAGARDNITAVVIACDAGDDELTVMRRA